MGKYPPMKTNTRNPRDLTDNDIEWGDPPEPRVGGNPKLDGVWVGRLTPFRERPQEWGKLPGRWSTGTATAIKSGKAKGIERGAYDAAARNPTTTAGKTTCEVWVRFLGVATEGEVTPFRNNGEAVEAAPQREAVAV